MSAITSRLQLDPSSSVPLVQQISDNLRVLLAEGDLAAGMALPSVRRLALDLGVHFNTVADAYRQLAAERWLEVKRGSGVRVIERHQQDPNPADLSVFRRRVRQLAAQLRAAGVPSGQLAAELRDLAEVFGKVRHVDGAANHDLVPPGDCAGMSSPS